MPARMRCLTKCSTFFVGLDATDEQLDFPVLYAIGIQGIAKKSLHEDSGDLSSLFDLIVDHIPAPQAETTRPFKMLVSNVEWNDYLGRIAVGRVEQGLLRKNQDLMLVSREGKSKQKARATKLFTFSGLERVPVEEVFAGDIVAIAGYEGTSIGDTLTVETDPAPIPYFDIDMPTIAMYFRVNDSPFAGLEGKYVTSNMIKDRLDKETRINVSLKVEQTENPDVFKVAGRGELQLAILIETMRREGYEFAVSRPEVVLREIEGVVSEPVEEVVIDVDAEYSSKVVDILLNRKGIMMSMNQEGDNTRIAFKVPSRGLIGFRNDVLTETRGTAMIHQQFDAYEPFKGDIAGRTMGALIALENGNVTGYALEGVQDRGIFFCEPGDPVYAGQVVGVNNRADDMILNVVKKKNLTNHRASQTSDSVKIAVARKMSLEQCIEFIDDNELLEITPKSIRIRKKYLDHNDRKRLDKK